MQKCRRPVNDTVKQHLHMQLWYLRRPSSMYGWTNASMMDIRLSCTKPKKKKKTFIMRKLVCLYSQEVPKAWFNIMFLPGWKRASEKLDEQLRASSTWTESTTATWTVSSCALWACGNERPDTRASYLPWTVCRVNPLLAPTAAKTERVS